MSDEFHTETITTPAGEYTLALHYDAYADSPFDAGSTFSTGVVLATRSYLEVGATGEASADTERVYMIEDAIRNGHSPRAIVRWLRLCHGAAGFVELSREPRDGSVSVSDLDEATSSTTCEIGSGCSYGATPQLEGLACIFPADYAAAMGTDEIDPDRARVLVRGEWTEYSAYSSGDVFGWILTDPDGEDMDACAGYYGDTPAQRERVREEATESALEDARRRLEEQRRDEEAERARLDEAEHARARAARNTHVVDVAPDTAAALVVYAPTAISAAVRVFAYRADDGAYVVQVDPADGADRVRVQLGTDIVASTGKVAQ